MLKELTVVTNHISVTHVEKLLLKEVTSLCMKEFTLVTNHISVTHVEKLLLQEVT